MPMILRRLILFVFVFHLADACRAQDVVRIRGSNTMGERIVPVLVDGWMKQIGYRRVSDVRRPGGLREITGERDGETLVVQVAGNGGAAGFQDLIDGNTELSMLARAPTAKELDDGWQLGRLRSPDQEFVIALQAMTIVVNPANPIKALDQAQLAKIFAGRITDWQQIGGTAGPIVLHLPDASTGLGQMQAQLLGIGKAAGIVRHARPADIEHAVASDVRALGVAEFGRPSRSTRALAIGVAGRNIKADRLNVMTEEYPLTRRLQFYSGQLITALGRGFVDYSVSDAGQRFLAAHGFTTMAPSSLPSVSPDERISGYSDLVAGAQRISLDIHFGDEFSLFESRSAQDLLRLQAFMRRPENIRRRLILVGISDRQSTPYMALSVSNERADLVAQALSDLGVFPLKVRGLGAVLPLVTEQNRPSRNLRVQVWVR